MTISAASQPQKTRLLWIDAIRLVAMICVVLVHVVDPIVIQFGETVPESWWWYQFADALGRLATPCFFMISGFLLLKKEESLGVFFRKRVSKVVIPLVVWSIFYALVLQWTKGGWAGLGMTLLGGLFAPVESHLWFLYAMVGLYFTMPFLRVIVKHSDTRRLWAYVGVWFLAVAVIPMLTYFLPVRSRYDFGAISGHVGYLVLGLLLGKMHLSKKHAVIAVVVIAITLTVNVVGTYWLSVWKGQYSRLLIDRQHPTTILYSASVFILIRYFMEHIPWNLKEKRFATVLQRITSASYGIYLVQAFVLRALSEGWFGFKLTVNAWGHPIYMIPLVTLIALVISYWIIWVLQRIPIVKHAVP